MQLSAAASLLLSLLPLEAEGSAFADSEFWGDRDAADLNFMVSVHCP